MLLNKKKVQFVNQSFDRCQFGDEDFCYMDPPYAGTKGMYYGGINLPHFFAWLKAVPCRWMLSFDGRRGTTDNTFDVPKDLYFRHEYLHAGNSSFERCLGKNMAEDIHDSLYMNYKPELLAEKNLHQYLLF